MYGSNPVTSSDPGRGARGREGRLGEGTYAGSWRKGPCTPTTAAMTAIMRSIRLRGQRGAVTGDSGLSRMEHPDCGATPVSRSELGRAGWLGDPHRKSGVLLRCWVLARNDETALVIWIWLCPTSARELRGDERGRVERGSRRGSMHPDLGQVAKSNRLRRCESCCFRADPRLLVPHRFSSARRSGRVHWSSGRARSSSLSDLLGWWLGECARVTANFRRTSTDRPLVTMSGRTYSGAEPCTETIGGMVGFDCDACHLGPGRVASA